MFMELETSILKFIWQNKHVRILRKIPKEKKKKKEILWIANLFEACKLDKLDRIWWGEVLGMEILPSSFIPTSQIPLGNQYSPTLLPQNVGSNSGCGNLTIAFTWLFCLLWMERRKWIRIRETLRNVCRNGSMMLPCTAKEQLRSWNGFT